MNTNNNFDYKLDQEELQILEDIEHGKYISLKDDNPEEFKKQKEMAEIIAKNTIKMLTKKKTYTIKFIENDIETIKGMALKKGLPYQTFIASILHQVATEQIKV